MKSEELVKGDVIRYNRKAAMVTKVNERGIEIRMFVPHSTFKRTGVVHCGSAAQDVKLSRIERINFKH